ncbi:unnamed protein product [Nezara viridula]|uniref:Intraflagellar transport protein 140 homolog n=1 Tax=Nezara viridula TaxID=85310 RepID=A0A9P0GVA3_NEZVI|nr:unnamed protein product [Nezara viridula]
MTLYFDYRVNIGELSPNAAFTAIEWHSQHPLLSVALYSIEKGGAVFLCDELGEKLKDVDPTLHPISQVSCLSWHPSRRTLVICWQNGEIRTWNGDSDYTIAPATKIASIVNGKWSQQGSKFITIDSDGDICGWRLDARGQLVPLYTLHWETGIAIQFEMRIAKPTMDLAGLAKKAVAGDERALDIFSAWRPRTAGRRTAVSIDSTSFYVATNTGSVFHVNESGSKQEVLSSLGNIQLILHHESEDYLLVVLDGLNMNYYSVDTSGSLHEMSKVKLSGSSNGRDTIVWAGPGLLACAVGDLTIRFWQPTTGDTYSITVSNADEPNKQTIISLTFSKLKGLLCACTNSGFIVIWRVSGEGFEAWQQVASTKVKQNILKAAWGINQLAVNTSGTVYVLKEQPLSATYHDGVSVVQTSATQLVVSKGDETAELNTDLQALGVSLYKEVVAVWSGKVIAVYHINPISSISVVGSFECECMYAGVWEQSIVVLTNSGRLQVVTLQGTVKQNIETDGQPITLSLTRHFMTISTITGLLQLWDLSRREARPHSKVKDLIEAIADFGEVITAVCNSAGTRVAFTIAKNNLLPSPAVFLWNIDVDSVQSYFFNADNEPTRFVTSVLWDPDEPQLFACEAKRSSSQNTSKRYPRDISKYDVLIPTTILVSFLSSAEHGLLLRESLSMDDDYVSLLAVSIPYFVVAKKPPSQQKIMVDRIVMKDFEGLEDCDSATKNAVINFSFSLSIGDVDEAFKSICSMKSGVVIWRNLARMCVTTRRLDVAKICLGNMGDSKGVSELIKAEDEPEAVRVAILAMRLGMSEEAEKLLTECNRFDIKNKLYQRRNLWDKALETAQKYDRIHLKNTYHQYGKYLESEGDTDGASHMYYRAETHRHEVPRMLLCNTPALEKYIVNSKDPILLKWWAQYMESTGQMDIALKFYEEAGDTFSLVRVLCYLKETEKATVLAENSNDKAACNHLARHLEHRSRIQEAVHFYTVATAYNNAIRLCKEEGLEDQLWALALAAGRREQAEAANFLQHSSPERAVLLYHKAGMLHRALDLAFRNNHFDAVEQIATELTSENDTDLLTRCAQYFIDQHHYEKAVHLLAVAKQYVRAIEDCWEHNVILTDELAEKLTPDDDHSDRIVLIEKLAECALAQANYHLAAKKFTQAGSKMKAMKALLKSGDTDKIVFFANVSRQKEMYVMAANYLQSLDWRSKPELLKNIVNFYTKGKAPQLLANFYIACAQVEVDEYSNYNKALGALNEAAKTLTNIDHHSNLKEAISRKIALVNKFLDAKRLFERSESDAAMDICRMLVAEADGDLVKKGDVFALMVENYVREGDLASAKALVNQLKVSHPNENVVFYITQDILKKLGMDAEMNSPGNELEVHEQEEEIIDETSE